MLHEVWIDIDIDALVKVENNDKTTECHSHCIVTTEQLKKLRAEGLTVHEDFAKIPDKFKRDGKRAHEYMGWAKGDAALPEEGVVNGIAVGVPDEEIE